MEAPQSSIRIVVGTDAAARRAEARGLLERLDATATVRVVGPTREAVDELVREASGGREATFGIHRHTLLSLASSLAWEPMARQGRVRASPLGMTAVAARATHEALAQGSIPGLEPVARFPGFPEALASTITELRQAGIRSDELASAGAETRELGDLYSRCQREIDRARLSDAAFILRAATAALERSPDPVPPVVLIDVAVGSPAAAAFVAALARRAPSFLATVPSGDARTLALLAPLHAPEEIRPGDVATSLERLRRHVFMEGAVAEAPPDDSVVLFSAPGESRECVEIARFLLHEAAAGVPFDRMAVLLRTPGAYTDALSTALRRAGIPAYATHGSARPDPAGRAFLAILACAAEGLSARRFAEYLSLGQVPDRSPAGAPPTGRAAWEPPADELPPAVQLSLFRQALLTDADVDASSLSAPHRWEAHLTESAVIGSRDRWRRRLRGYEAELRARLREVEREEPGAPRALGIRRDLASLKTLQAFALPVVEALAALPAGKSWGEWLDALAALAPRVLRRPERVLSLLSELAPLHAVAPVGIHEVMATLHDRLATLPEDPPRNRYGRVFVAPIAECRGMTFDVVLVPGLAERLFPRRPLEDPLLSDACRCRLPAASALATQRDRAEEERLLLRLAAGAAQRRLYLSWPRIDAGLGRPRVPSFYLLDVRRATRGHIGDVEAFEREAAEASGARLSWPAPPDPALAIDDMEHDLAVLGPLLRGRPREARGRARYLLSENPHLARHLRGRHMRWRREWGSWDGLLRPGTEARRILASHGLKAKAYSPTSLQGFAACPYRFLLHAVHRLAPREEPEALETMDPLTRGSVVHAILAEALRAMASAGLFPLTEAVLPEARGILEEAVARVAARYLDDLAPAVPRVFEDEIASIRTDLRHWLSVMAREAGWRPRWFELGFGLPRDPDRDPESHPDPAIVLGGYRLHGAIDLVEERGDGPELRVTDFKTGRDSAPARFTLAKGAILQPVLYGLALGQITGRPVTAGRLAYCTWRGHFSERVVAVDARARNAAGSLLAAIDEAVTEGRLLAAPRQDECRLCDFLEVCGPYEELRASRKDPAELKAVAQVRRLE